nr:hypothetical protein [Tanacetum cinerariifolium]
MRELREDAFSENKNEDAHYHVDRVLNIVDIRTPGAVNTCIGNTDGLTAIVSKLDNLGRDMKKLKENIHAIQVGCLVMDMLKVDKIKVRRTKPDTGSKRARKIKAEGKFI